LIDMVYYILVGIFSSNLLYHKKRLLSYPFKGGCSLFLLRVFLQRLFYVAFYIHNRQTNGLQTVANAENGAFLLLPGLCYGTIICAK
ncbi:MAG: hypothetical protein U0K34_11255, partial [Ruminococcus sp.]|nr:hypothetical protein [Ruminococcus sp.]